MTRFIQSLKLEDLEANRETYRKKMESARKAWERAQVDHQYADRAYREALLLSRTDALPVGTFIKYGRKFGSRMGHYGRVVSVGLMPAHETKLSYQVACCAPDGREFLPNGKKIMATVTAMQPHAALPDPLAQVQP